MELEYNGVGISQMATDRMTQRFHEMCAEYAKRGLSASNYLPESMLTPTPPSPFFCDTFMNDARAKFDAVFEPPAPTAEQVREARDLLDALTEGCESLVALDPGKVRTILAALDKQAEQIKRLRAVADAAEEKEHNEDPELVIQISCRLRNALLALKEASHD